MKKGMSPMMKKVTPTVMPSMETNTLGKVPDVGGMGAGVGKNPKLVLGGNAPYFATKKKAML